MSLETELVADLAQVAASLRHPRVKALHLPPARPQDPLAGESCAIELDDGSVGLSYALFADTLKQLNGRRGACAGQAADTLVQGLTQAVDGPDPLARTLGLAAANALTASLFNRSGFVPLATVHSLGGLEPARGEQIGMIGCFPSLLSRITATGAALVVLELREELLGQHDGVTITADPRALAPCTQVLATGTLVLNGTLQAMRAAARSAHRFSLIGPSASILPDALLTAGVTHLGGSWIESPADYLAALSSGEKRQRSSRKFLLDGPSYPGLEALLTRL